MRNDDKVRAYARTLEGIAGDTVQVDAPLGVATAAEAAATKVWFHTNFNVDCRRADRFNQTAVGLRQHIAELVDIADRIEAAAKRRKGARS